MGQLDLKKLSKGMNIEDKMKLLFEDMNQKAESHGGKTILTPQERDAIIDDARKSGEIREIRRVNELYFLSNFTAINMEISQLLVYLSTSQLEKTLMGIILKGAADELVGEILYDWVKNDKTEKSQDTDNKMDELRKKYIVDSILFRGFDFFDPVIDKEEIEPNKKIQKAFMAAFLHAKNLTKKLLEMDLIIKKSPINFLPKKNIDLIQESKELLVTFTNLDSTFRPLRIYRDYGITLTGEVKISDPEFLKIIKDISKALELTNEEIGKIEADIDKHLREEL